MFGIIVRNRPASVVRLQRLVQPSLWAPVLSSRFKADSQRTPSKQPENLSFTSWDLPLTSWDLPVAHETADVLVALEDDALANLLSETVQEKEHALKIQHAVTRLGVKELDDMKYVRSGDLCNHGVPVVAARRFLEACKRAPEPPANAVNLLRLSQGLDSLPFKKVGPITESEVNAAQELWGQSIVEIGRAYLDGGDYAARAAQALDELYAYGRHNVLFKPTKAAETQFRSGRKDALSYFVGGDKSHPEDTGFALVPWTAVRFEPCNFTTLNDITLAMGNYYFTDTTGKDTKVEYTFGYWRDEIGAVRIVLHHSSLPFKQDGPIMESEVHAMQERWGQGIVDIGRAYVDGQDYVGLAEQVLDELYAYGRHEVLFKPTKAANAQFRRLRKDALSYFIGGDESHPEDKGFALTPWTGVRFEPSGLTTLDDSTVAMGNYFFTDTAGQETKVEYTFGYWRDETGGVRIVLHHSSIPYTE